MKKRWKIVAVIIGVCCIAAFSYAYAYYIHDIVCRYYPIETPCPECETE